MLITEVAKSEWLQRIRGEYLEVPGTNLTKQQMQRLWRLDAGTCDVMVEALVAAGFLKPTRSHGYVRAVER
jgi:hypothetical protein